MSTIQFDGKTRIGGDVVGGDKITIHEVAGAIRGKEELSLPARTELIQALQTLKLQGEQPEPLRGRVERALDCFERWAEDLIPLVVQSLPYLAEYIGG